MELLFKACIHTSLKRNQWGERRNHEYTENYHNSIHVKASPVKSCLDLYKIVFIVYVLPIVCNDVIQYMMVSHVVRTKLLANDHVIGIFKNLAMYFIMINTCIYQAHFSPDEYVRARM